MATTNSPRKRKFLRTARALADFIVEQEARVSSFPQRNPERAAIKVVLTEVERRAPWQALDRFVARAHNATLAGTVMFIADKLGGLHKRGFPPSGLAKSIAGGCADLHPNYGGPNVHRRAVTLRREVARALDSKAVRRVLFGRIPGQPRGPVAAAEQLVSQMTGVAISTIRCARRELGRLRR